MNRINKPSFWAHVAISPAIAPHCRGVSKPVSAAFNHYTHATLEFNPQARHFIMLDQPDWLTAQITKALKD